MQPEIIVTVLMPLYNGAQYVREAVESILGQTFRDFELLIIDDGSSDEGPDIVGGIRDQRIVLLRNSRNMGVAATLNRGLAVAQGRYIARMDADDISLPDRLERQIHYMDKHQDIGISGGRVRLFGGGQLPYTCWVPTDYQAVKAYMLFENPLWHMTVIMRKGMVQDASLKYNPVYSRSEDYDLWVRAGHYFSLTNVDHTLVRVRRHKKSVTRSNWDQMTNQTEIIQERILRKIGLQPSPSEISFHHLVGRGYRLHRKSDIKQAEDWLLQILAVNEETKVYNQCSLNQIVGKVWFRLCVNAGPLGIWVWHAWRSSPLNALIAVPTPEKLRFMASILWHKTRKTRKSTA